MAARLRLRLVPTTTRVAALLVARVPPSRLRTPPGLFLRHPPASRTRRPEGRRVEASHVYARRAAFPDLVFAALRSPRTRPLGGAGAAGGDCVPALPGNGITLVRERKRSKLRFTELHVRLYPGTRHQVRHLAVDLPPECRALGPEVGL